MVEVTVKAHNGQSMQQLLDEWDQNYHAPEVVMLLRWLKGILRTIHWWLLSISDCEMDCMVRQQGIFCIQAVITGRRLFLQ